MEANDIRIVLQLAKTARDADNYDAAPDQAAIDQNTKAIDAVETWLTEIGALPPR